MPEHATGTRGATLYLGTHRPQWVSQVTVPLFISRRVLHERKTFPQATTRWVLDSGGYTELASNGHWSISTDQYATEVRRYQQEIGRLEWAAPMDWMCEPSVREKTGLTVKEHQRRTIQNYLALDDKLGPTVVPVLQGWTLDEYLDHVDQWDRVLDITAEPIVAVGSVCRRGQDDEIVKILDRLAREGLRLHAFGVRSSALERIADALISADSMAWSYRARRSEPLPGHTHKSCANCKDFALLWHAEQMRRLSHTRLEVAA